MPGIGISNAIPFNKGVSWSSYWKTRNPTLLNVTGMRDTEIDFAWTDNSAGDCSFAIYRSTDGVTYTGVGTTVAGDTTYTATGLTAGVLYYFYVVGVKEANESDPTNIYDTRFKITVDTTKAGSAADTFVLPTTGGGYNAYVDWGDGGAEQNITGTPGAVSHTYATSGTYQIKVRGTFPQIYFNNAGDKAKLITIDNWGNIKWSSMSYAFRGASNMQGAWLDVPNMTAAAFNMDYMFSSCSIFDYEVSGFNTSAVTTMMGVFDNTVKFNKSINGWNTSNVISMRYMFVNCALYNQPMSGLNTSKVKDFMGMFLNCKGFKQSIASFSLAAAVNLNDMLNGCNINATGTTTNYDATLIAWAAQTVKPNVNFHGGTSKYSSGAAATARGVLTSAPNSWTITDGGQI